MSIVLARILTIFILISSPSSYAQKFAPAPRPTVTPKPTPTPTPQLTAGRRLGLDSMDESFWRDRIPFALDDLTRSIDLNLSYPGQCEEDPLADREQFRQQTNFDFNCDGVLRSPSGLPLGESGLSYSNTSRTIEGEDGQFQYLSRLECRAQPLANQPVWIGFQNTRLVDFENKNDLQDYRSALESSGFARSKSGESLNVYSCEIEVAPRYEIFANCFITPRFGAGGSSLGPESSYVSIGGTFEAQTGVIDLMTDIRYREYRNDLSFGEVRFGLGRTLPLGSMGFIRFDGGIDLPVGEVEGSDSLFYRDFDERRVNFGISGVLYY